MTVHEPYHRQSTLLELSRTPIGSFVRKLVALQVKSAATTKDEARMFAGAASYMTVEKMVRASGGTLTWPIADSIIDIANGKTRQVFVRAAVAGRDVVRSKLASLREAVR